MSKMAVTVTGALPTSFLPTQIRHLQLPFVSPTQKQNMVSTAAKGWVVCQSVSVNARFGSSKGGAGVLERPTFDQSQFDPSTQVLEGGDIGRLKNKKGPGSGDSYRVLLIDDARHTEKLVAKVLPHVVPSVTPDDARRLFQVSRENGVAIVIVTVKEHAEFYAQMMIRGGLRSTIEPDSSTV
ncbi:hypothetical protein HS088_TW03G00349 [Tripterygium wilfordii]|uniref:Adaptor protein ClpS core domain-containing protein n=1 Tax=Tripterygium wilfordii TaxID=458696 RepID=A0A7J7DUI0_TRIWF|nr:ATP-dependent Clp protease adapter protein CLPS2, chloroplastic-like [Tripterygium wilfordii]KAF5750020.1 hypothetical protein HS088_TW03G00349 [Tripterygium wilfordii]